MTESLFLQVYDESYLVWNLQKISKKSHVMRFPWDGTSTLPTLLLLRDLYETMTIFSPLASRRKNRRIAEATQQLIIFRLLDEGFALPIRAVQKVIPMGKIYGTPGGAGVSLTLYQDRELIVIDIERRIFRGRPREDSFKRELREQSEEAPNEAPPIQHYLLIVQSSSGQLVGLPLVEPPSLQRVPESAFAPLSSAYISEGNLRCVSALIKRNNDEPPLFLLNPDQLVQKEPTLPPA